MSGLPNNAKSTAQVSRTSPSATTMLTMVVCSPVTLMTPQDHTGQAKAEVFFKKQLKELKLLAGIAHLCM